LRTRRAEPVRGAGPPNDVGLPGRSSSATVLSLVPGSLAQDEDQVPPLGGDPSPFSLAALWLNGGVADRSDMWHRTAEPNLWRYVVVGRRCLKTVALLCFGRR